MKQVGEAVVDTTREAAVAATIAQALHTNGVPHWMMERPPQTQSNRLKALESVHPNPRYWPFGSRKFTVFLARGEQRSQVDNVVPDADSIVAGCKYVTVHDIMEAKPMKDRLEIRQRVLAEGLAEGFEDKSPEYYQRELQLVFEQPDLRLRHILTGVEAGCPAHVYGVTHFEAVADEDVSS